MNIKAKSGIRVEEGCNSTRIARSSGGKKVRVQRLTIIEGRGETANASGEGAREPEHAVGLDNTLNTVFLGQGYKFKLGDVARGTE